MPLVENTLRDSILEFEASVVAYHSIYENNPTIKITFLYSLYTWCKSINMKLADNLERLYRGECKEVLNLDYHRLFNKSYWIDAKAAKYVTANGHIQLKDCGILLTSKDFDTFADLHRLYEKEIEVLVAHLKEVKGTFDHPHLYDNFMVEMKEKHSDPCLIYEYDTWKDEQLDLSIKQLVAMQMQACVDFLNSGVLHSWISITNEEVDEVKEEELLKWLPSKHTNTKNLKELWAKLKKFVDIIEDTIVIPKHQLIRKFFLQHIDDIQEEQVRAIFRLDYLLKLIHQDMVKQKPELSKYLPSPVVGSLEGTKYFAPYKNLAMKLKEQWFKELRTDGKYDDNWADRFSEGFMQSEYGSYMADNWKEHHGRIMGYVIGCLKEAGVIDRSVSNDCIARHADMMRNWRSLGKYIGKDSLNQPYARWIINNVDKYC